MRMRAACRRARWRRVEILNPAGNPQPRVLNKFSFFVLSMPAEEAIVPLPLMKRSTSTMGGGEAT